LLSKSETIGELNNLWFIELDGKILGGMKITSLNPIPSSYQLLLLVVLTTTALFLLVSSLNNLELGPGERFYVLEQPEEEQDLFIDYGLRGESFFRGLAYLALALFLISLIVVIRSKENRKQAIKLIARNLLVLAGFVLLITFFSIFNTSQDEVDEEVSSPANTFQFILPASEIDEADAASPLEYTPPSQPSGLIFFITLMLILALGAGGYSLWQHFHPPKAQLDEIARKALKELAVSNGKDWQDIVIRCYADMSSVVSRRMDLHRNKSMTPAEFSSRLVNAGLPPNPVHNLTRLFEKARYSNVQSSPVDIREAMTCLSAILQVVERQT
jgi:hypothetical protein